MGAYVTHQRFTRADESQYWDSLKGALSECMRRDSLPCSLLGEEIHDEAAVLPIRRHIRRWFKRGAPIDPQGQGAPAGTLRIVIRQMVLAVPTLSLWHGDARLWLRYPEVRARTEAARAKLREDMKTKQFCKPISEDWVPWNLMLYAPKNTPYENLNRKGFEVTVGGDAPRAQFPDEPRLV